MSANVDLMTISPNKLTIWRNMEYKKYNKELDYSYGNEGNKDEEPSGGTG